MLGNVVVTVATEFISCVWLEVMIFGSAAIMYLALFGKQEDNKYVKEGHGDAVVKPARSSHNNAHAASTDNDSALMPLATALHNGKIEDACSVLVQLPGMKLKAVLNETAPRLLAVAAASPDLAAAASLIRDLLKNMEPKMLEVAVEVAVLEAHKRKDVYLCYQLDGVAGLLLLPRSQVTLTTLANSYLGDIKALRKLVHAADFPFTKAFATAALRACAASNSELVMEILERVEPMDKDALAAYAGHLCLTSQSQPQMKTGAAVDSRIRECARKRDLPGAVAAFGSIPLQSGRTGAQLFASIVIACADCGNWNLAKQYLLRARHHRVFLDPPITTVLVKSLMAAGETSFAEQMLQDASTLGLPVCASCYHILLLPYVVAGNRRAAWCLVAKMHNANVEPTLFTCSILLKMTTTRAHAADLLRIMELVKAIRAPVDNILLSSITDACMKTARLDLLMDFVDFRESLHKAADKTEVSLADEPLEIPLYGSLIKAFGQAGEMKRVWRLWEEMQAKGVTATEVTLGCMIESLVANSQAESAWKLVQEIWQDEDRRHLVNTVIYATLMKGFPKQPVKVEELYREMKERAIQGNIVLYNTMLNIIVRCRMMHRMPSILDDMRSAMPQVEPDLVTYSTLIKGFCAWGQLDHALGLLEEIQVSCKFRPDEMMYNSLLDGCYREGRVCDGTRLVAEMKRDGVAPSNYTLSMLVKLFSRGKRLDQAFSIVDELSAEFGLRPNVHVYTCLIQGCFKNQLPVKALSLLDMMLANGVHPDERAYGVLVRGHLNMGDLDKAVEIVESAYQGQSPAGVDPACLREVMTKLRKRSSEAAAALWSKVQTPQPQPKQWTSLRHHSLSPGCGVPGRGLMLHNMKPFGPTLETQE